jgi:hypothetical protein
MEPIPEEQVYTYTEVKKILCEGCRYGLPLLLDGGRMHHRVNGTYVACCASVFISATAGGASKGNA